MNAGDFRGDVVGGGDWRFRDFRGQRVAVIATGAEAARIVPHVVRTARSVKLFQSSADWMSPTRVRLPLVAGPLARLHLRMAVKDAWTRRQLTPYVDPGRGRGPASRAFYRAVQQPNCKLITWPVYAVVPHGVRSAEGIEHQVDVIIVGAGIDLGTSNREERIA